MCGVAGSAMFALIAGMIDKQGFAKWSKLCQCGADWLVFFRYCFVIYFGSGGLAMVARLFGRR